MNITYTKNGKDRALSFIEGHWTGDDFELVGLLNANVSAVVGHHEYYPTPWHKAKDVADFLNGVLDTPEPSIPSEPGVIY